MASDDLLIERLLRVIDEGRRTATYKLALLLGIIDTAATMPNETELPTRAIAERVLELYYPQTRSYVDRNGVTFMPRQISMKSSTVLAAVERLRVTGDAMRCRSIDEVARRAQRDYERTLDVVEDTFVRYPIPLLQTIGTTPIPFLYAVDWSEGTTVASLRRSNGDRIRLLDGVADRLVVLGPMLRPLIEHHWTQDVARWTRITTEDAQLRSHLFGRERAAFPKVLAGGLLELQAGSCFYCEARLDKRVEVDHFQEVVHRTALVGFDVSGRDPPERVERYDSGDSAADRVEQHELPGVEQQRAVGSDQELVEGEAGRADVGDEGRDPVDAVGDLVDRGGHGGSLSFDDSWFRAGAGAGGPPPPSCAR